MSKELVNSPSFLLNKKKNEEYKEPIEGKTNCDKYPNKSVLFEPSYSDEVFVLPDEELEALLLRIRFQLQLEKYALDNPKKDYQKKLLDSLK